MQAIRYVIVYDRLPWQDLFLHLYRPQGMFLHVSVILSTGGESGRPPGQTHPHGRQTPPPPHEQTPPPCQTDTPSGQKPPGQTPPSRQTSPQGRPLQRTVRILLECILVKMIFQTRAIMLIISISTTFKFFAFSTYSLGNIII